MRLLSSLCGPYSMRLSMSTINPFCISLSTICAPSVRRPIRLIHTHQPTDRPTNRQPRIANLKRPFFPAYPSSRVHTFPCLPGRGSRARAKTRQGTTDRPSGVCLDSVATKIHIYPPMLRGTPNAAGSSDYPPPLDWRPGFACTCSNELSVRT